MKKFDRNKIFFTSLKFISHTACFLFILSVVFYGCVVISPEQQLLENETTEKMGVCNSEAAALSQSSVDEENRFDPENISILNWNIHKNNADDWADDFKLFAADQDIVIIQEAHLNSQLRNILTQQDMHWSLNAAFYLREKPLGVLTASPIKPHYSCGYRTKEPIIRLPKSVLLHYYGIKGTEQSLLVGNIHSINFTLGTRSYQKQIDKLRKIAQKHSGPMIIAGDFNSWSDERRAIVDEMVAALSLKTCQLKNSNQVRVFGKVIDLIFYRGLEAVAQDSSRVSTSDHNPIQIRFRLAHI